MYTAMANRADGEGTTRLHLDVTDAANIMVWAASGDAPAATWHIFPRTDAARLKEAIRSLNWCEPDEHPIYSQSVYLKPRMLEVLRQSYDVRPWVIEQSVGDLVVIPAGAAHQVSAGYYTYATGNELVPANHEVAQVWNKHGAIKIASDFISVVNGDSTAEIAREWRADRLRTRKPDLLQLRNTLWLEFCAASTWSLAPASPSHDTDGLREAAPAMPLSQHSATAGARLEAVGIATETLAQSQASPAVENGCRLSPSPPPPGTMNTQAGERPMGDAHDSTATIPTQVMSNEQPSVNIPSMVLPSCSAEMRTLLVRPSWIQQVTRHEEISRELTIHSDVRYRSVHAMTQLDRPEKPAACHHPSVPV